MSVTVPYSEFTTVVTSTLGIDCGALSYTVSPVTLEPNDPSLLTNLSIDSASQTVEITVDRSFIPDGLTAEFGLTGTLQNYPTISHSETF